MASSRLVVAVLALACVTAAGGYLATRQGPSPLAASAAPATVVDPAGPVAVEETEAIIDEPAKAGGQGKLAEAPISTKRVETPSKRAATPPAAPRTSNSTATNPTSSPVSRPAPVAEAPPVVPAPTPTPSAPEPVAASAPVPEPPPVARDEEPRAPEPVRAPEPPPRAAEELIVSADSVIGLQMETAVSSEKARVEDRVEARVARDVRVGGQVAIPAGSRAIGSVMMVERGGKVNAKARLGIRFHTLILADGTRLPITTETVYRNGDAPGDKSAAKIGGGAVAGAILGAIIGGAKGAAIGGAVGAGAGTTAVMAGDRSAATFAAGSEVTPRILAPVTVIVEK